MNLGAFVYKEWVVFWRSKLDLWLTLLPPVIIVFFFSLGMAATVERVQGVPYPEFLVPGIAAFSVVGSALSLSSRTFNEKFSPVLSEYFSLPSSRTAYVVAKLATSVVLATAQGLVFLLAGGLAFGIPFSAPSLLLSCTILALAAVSLSGLFIVLGLLVNDMAGFLVASNVLSLVLTYSSGIFYPAEALPGYVRWLAVLNPASHAAELLRQVLVFDSAGPALFGVLFLVGAGAVLGTAAAFLLDRKAAKQV